MDRNSPTVRLRRLSLELRALREQAGLNRQAAGRLAGFSASKMTRMEQHSGGWRLPDAADVRTLLDVYGVTDKTRRDALVRLVREANQRGWWQSYRDVPPDYATYIGLETEAKVILNYETTVIPGLLQTEDYARALIRGRLRDLPDSIVEERVEVRMERQARLVTDTQDPVRLWAIVDEAVLYRQVGGAEVMRAQLEHLLKMAESPAVTVQVLHLTSGAAPGVGPFSILTFRDPLDPEVVYLETAVGALWVEDTAKVARFKAQWEHLVIDAAKRDETLEAIGAALSRLPGEEQRHVAESEAQ